MSQLIHKKTNTVLAKKVIQARSFVQRLKGLIPFKTFPEHQALWIQPGSSIHTLFMSFPIDVIFADKNLCVKHWIQRMPPGKITSGLGPVLPFFTGLIHPLFLYQSVKAFFQINHVFEFKAGQLDHTPIQKGDQIYVDS